MKSKLSLAVCAILLFSLFCGCGTSAPEVTESPVPATLSPSASNPTIGPDDKNNDLSAYYAKDYAEVFELFNTSSGNNRGDFTVAAEPEETEVDDSAQADTAIDSIAVEMPAADDYYSETNVQVKGIDEGDIVKTDGKYIYVLRNGVLMIYEAAGADTAILGRLELGSSSSVKQAEGYEHYYEYSGKTPQEMYIFGTTAVVISSEYYSLDCYNGETWRSEYTDRVSIDFIDVSDPAAPAAAATVTQDGYCQASRLLDGRLYLVSTYYVSGNPEEGEPRGYVPCFTVDGLETPLSPDSIAILPDTYSRSYAVIGVYDVSGASLSHAECLLGAGNTVYMTADSLYLADSRYYEDSIAERQESIYTVTDYVSGECTDITRYDLSEGSLTLAATGSVPGWLESQFSMDEYNGYLRLVTTVYESRYTVYYDAEHEFTNYVWSEDKDVNGLYILDETLNTVGSIEGLAEDERVYSARFDGDIGYFVTFRRTDPLFAVDLSDPTAPVVLSELKIPGFSEYLHVWGDGRLFGLGMNADEETGLTSGIKLSMFDTSNPADVREACTLCLDSSTSEALYNHKAILISPDRNIIGFPADGSYLIYGYTDETGFEKRAEIACGDSWGYDSRGLYIGNYAYIISDTITVLDLDSMTLAATISLG